MSVIMEDAPAPLPVGKVVSVLGGIVSLGLIIGVGYWGYDLIKRDVSGVPVVQALEGPMRIQPTDPGGRPAENQGLAVNAVAATGAAEAPADRLTLAPQAVELRAEDQPGAELAEITPEDTRASIETLVEELSNGVQPLQPLAEEAAPADNEVLTRSDTGLLNSVVDLAVPGVRKSWHPPVRPERAVRAVPAAAVQLLDASVAEIAPDAIERGTRLAQLGAFDSAEEARSNWDVLATKFEDVMQGKSRVIEEASTGGRTFYRLRAHGFTDLSDARRFCSVFVSEKADCIPVTAR